jgi:hypothetical protein
MAVAPLVAALLPGKEIFEGKKLGELGLKLYGEDGFGDNRWRLAGGSPPGGFVEGDGEECGGDIDLAARCAMMNLAWYGTLGEILRRLIAAMRKPIKKESPEPKVT